MTHNNILVCPLDWGLGHATRCIPLIRELLTRGHRVGIGSSGNALALLQQEFPGCQFYELPAYNPAYQDKGYIMFQMIRQLPKFRKVIRAEHEACKRLIDEHHFNLIIADNRYGCYSPSVKSILITHQLSPLMPSGYSWLAPAAHYVLRNYTKHFQEIWIPDVPGSGFTAPFNLSESPPQRFVGWLSRFSRKDASKDLKYDILAVVSGPEPQRSALESILYSQLKSSGLRAMLVRGEPGKSLRKTTGSLEIVDHMTSDELEIAFRSSAYIISRSGYSTIMDLIAIGSKAIFIPTPQQPEQEFFAHYFSGNNVAFSVKQSSFSLPVALEKAKSFTGFSGFTPDGTYLKEAVDTLMPV